MNCRRQPQRSEHQRRRNQKIERGIEVRPLTTIGKQSATDADQITVIFGIDWVRNYARRQGLENSRLTRKSEGLTFEVETPAHALLSGRKASDIYTNQCRLTCNQGYGIVGLDISGVGQVFVRFVGTEWIA